MAPKSPKILFDARYIRTDFHDGVSRYSTELGNALAKLTPVTFIISDDKQCEFLPDGADVITLHATTSPREPLSSVMLNKYKPDVVFTPLQTMGSGGRKFKLVLTLHDLIYYKHRTPPHHLNLPTKLIWRAYHATYIPQRFTLNAADMVVTVSDTSKQEILDARLTKRPVVVVPNAPRDLTPFLTSKVSLAKKPQNLIYMGSFMRYKNVEALIAGMEYLPGRTLHLLSKITPKRKAELLKCVPNGAHIIFHNGVSDEEYANLLADNGVLVSASRAEGYGLSLAEASNLGVPIVVSDIPHHREVGGRDALYFGANQPREFANRVLELDDKNRREQLAAAGKKHIAKFDWNESAKTLLKAIKTL